MQTLCDFGMGEGRLCFKFLKKRKKRENFLLKPKRFFSSNPAFHYNFELSPHSYITIVLGCQAFLVE